MNTKYCDQCDCKEPKDGSRLCTTCISRNRRKRNPKWVVFDDLRWSARRRGIGFLLTFEEFKWWLKNTPDGRRYWRYRGRGMDDQTIDRKEEDDPYSLQTIQSLKKRDNIEKYHKHYGHKVNAIYQKIMEDCPF